MTRIVTITRGPKAPFNKTFKGYIINPNNKWSGYPRVKLNRNGEIKKESVHRLVALAFIPNPEDKPFINHKNAIRHDNRVANLEWCTPSENIKHAFNIGTKTAKSGKDSNLSKLTEDIVREIDKLLNLGELNQRQIAVRFSISHITVSDIYRGKSWSHITGRKGNVKGSKFSKGKFHPRSFSVINCRGEVFDTMADAAKAFNLKCPSYLTLACRDSSKSAGKYEDGSKVKWRIYES